MSTLQALITQEEQELPQGSPVIVGMLKTPEPEPCCCVFCSVTGYLERSLG